MINFDSSVDTKSITGLVAKLKMIDKPVEAAIRESLGELRNEASRFPAQPSRNRAPSGHYNTWIREKGRVSIGAFRSPRGAWKKKPGGGRLLQASEYLLKKWKTAPIKIQRGAGTMIGTLTNLASYAPFVQGDGKQAKFHAQTGWLTMSQIYQGKLKVIQDIFKAHIGDWLE